MTMCQIEKITPINISCLSRIISIIFSASVVTVQARKNIYFDQACYISSTLFFNYEKFMIWVYS